jgi:hypothetical protein
VQKKILLANTKLEKVQIIQRGKKLTFRATLPPKYGDGHKNKQYTISTGLPAKGNIRLGAKISQKFNKLDIPSPYHFRDAYAITGEVLNYNPALVAQWMGHTLDVHYKKYLRHINQRHA